MGVYAALGVAQAIAFFIMGTTFALLTYFASQRLHSVGPHTAGRTSLSMSIDGDRSCYARTYVFLRNHSKSQSPFVYTKALILQQPLGRIMNRFSKDIDTVDNTLGDALRMLFATAANILGAIILIAIVIPWFLVAVFVILLAYLWAAIFYRASAREFKVCAFHAHVHSSN